MGNNGKLHVFIFYQFGNVFISLLLIISMILIIITNIILHVNFIIFFIFKIT